MLKAPGPLACVSTQSHPNHPNYAHLGVRVHPQTPLKGGFLAFYREEQGGPPELCGACQWLVGFWELSRSKMEGCPKPSIDAKKLHPGTCWNSGLHAALRAAKRQWVAGALLPTMGVK